MKIRCPNCGYEGSAKKGNIEEDAKLHAVGGLWLLFLVLFFVSFVFWPLFLVAVPGLVYLLLVAAKDLSGKVSYHCPACKYPYPLLLPSPEAKNPLQPRSLSLVPPPIPSVEKKVVKVEPASPLPPRVESKTHAVCFSHRPGRDFKRRSAKDFPIVVGVVAIFFIGIIVGGWFLFDTFASIRASREAEAAKIVALAVKAEEDAKANKAAQQAALVAAINERARLAKEEKDKADAMAETKAIELARLAKEAKDKVDALADFQAKERAEARAAIKAKADAETAAEIAAKAKEAADRAKEEAEAAMLIDDLKAKDLPPEPVQDVPKTKPVKVVFAPKDWLTGTWQYKDGSRIWYRDYANGKFRVRVGRRVEWVGVYSILSPTEAISEGAGSKQGITLRQDGTLNIAGKYRASRVADYLTGR